ncbi:arginine--tRNA ligase [Devriesea agamarum]|uniref:arginine--tRNA ligase n=1 Tax=Devriesea agamarum TaxID=472569 RepID=UPI00071D3C8D|nr:arginine--tRNA ligase [Devriesea agamarum]
MTTPETVLTERFQSAFARAFGDEFATADPIIRPSQFADFQCNAAMGLAKRLGRAPRQIAADILEHAELSDVAEPMEVSGPGFLNIKLLPEWIASQVEAMRADERLGVPKEKSQNIPIDYSAPNVAKEMHVGHLRTTVVGDSLARTLEFLGHHVIRQNHIGDWGTPFGMLIEHLLEVGADSDEAALLRTSPNDFYQAARTKFESDPDFAARSRRRVVMLQGGDEPTLELWRELLDLSKQYFNHIYKLMDVTLTDDDLAGESMYNSMLPKVCEDLEAAGLARISDGALCAFPKGFTGREGNPLPLIVRKSDGGYGYATTDLATVRDRVDELLANRILYVIGAPQEVHLAMVFETSSEAGWLPESVQVIHVKIGNVLGEDGKILRTRSGAPLRLVSLLEEAVARARSVIDELRPDLCEDERAEVAHQIGIGAVKYADLSTSHDAEYVFDLERMLALQGNTAPYLQYAIARIRSVLRKAAAQGLEADESAVINLGQEQERALALQLLQFGPTVTQVGQTLEPHRLCSYLFATAQAFTSFYENCPILKESDQAIQRSRLALAGLCERVLVQGLDLLGVRAPRQM